MEIIVLIVWLVITFCAGCYLGRFLADAVNDSKQKDEEITGTLHVETMDPDGPFLFLELRTNIEDVLKKNRVIFDVAQNELSSQK